MSLADTFTWIESTPLAIAISESSWWFPTIETVHVFAVVLVVGSILIVDLRLLGLASRRRSVSEVTGEVLPITWACFALAVVTGSLLFSSHADKYAHNFQFQMKMVLLLLAGINMALFHRVTYRNVGDWHLTTPPPAARWAGGLSIFIWVSVIAFGRWIGFTT